MGVSLYSVLPNTLEMQHAKELGDMQSQVAKAFYLPWNRLEMKQINCEERFKEHLESQLT